MCSLVVKQKVINLCCLSICSVSLSVFTSHECEWWGLSWSLWVWYLKCGSTLATQFHIPNVNNSCLFFFFSSFFMHDHRSLKHANHSADRQNASRTSTGYDVDWPGLRLKYTIAIKLIFAFSKCRQIQIWFMYSDKACMCCPDIAFGKDSIISLCKVQVLIQNLQNHCGNGALSEHCCWVKPEIWILSTRRPGSNPLQLISETPKTQELALCCFLSLGKVYMKKRPIAFSSTNDWASAKSHVFP